MSIAAKEVPASRRRTTTAFALLGAVGLCMFALPSLSPAAATTTVRDVATGISTGKRQHPPIVILGVEFFGGIWL